MAEDARANSRKVQELQVTANKDGKSYVFISYKSDDWKTVLEDIVWELQRRYGLRVYFDKKFASSNEKWAAQMQDEIGLHCAAMLSFVSPKYLTSYATLMEVLYSQVENKSKRKYKKNVAPISILLNENRMEDVAQKISDAEQNENVRMESDEEALLKRWAGQGEAKGGSIAEAVGFLQDRWTSRAEIRKGEVSDACQCLLQGTHGLFLPYLENANEVARDAFFENLVSRIRESAASRAVEPPFDPAIREALRETPAPAPIQPAVAADKSAPMPEGARQAHKRASVTGDIRYTLEGESFCENQSEMMLRVFEKVLARHPEIREQAVKDLLCASRTDWKQASDQKEMPSYFRVCRTFHFPEGDQICIGTAFALQQKLTQIAKLLALCGESPEILQTDAFVLPKVSVQNKAAEPKPSSGSRQGGRMGNLVTYRLDGNQYTENQSEMLFRAIGLLLKRYPHCRQAMAQKLTCLELQPLEQLRREQRPSYFRVMRQVEVEGEICSIGAAYGLADKVRQIRVAMKICGAPQDFFALEGTPEH